jgi:hypothetical protein
MSDFDQWMASVERVVTVLKQRFPNLTVEETLKLAGECVRAVLAAQREEH